MNNDNCLTSVEKWIESCSGLIPLEVCTDHADRRAQKTIFQSFPNLKGGWLEALLGLRIGEIDRAHEIVQHGSTSMDRYMHGVVHRIEGDFWNAKYWFRQVDDNELLGRIGTEVSSRLKARDLFEPSKSFRIFDDRVRFAPQNLVDAQATVKAKAAAEDRALIQQIAQAEWESLWTVVKLQSIEPDRQV